jgi:KDO2-lipid IV(A) lauroyltransferase
LAWKTPTVAHHLESALLRGVHGVFRLMGVDVAAGVSGWIWRTFAPLTRRQKRAEIQLKLIFPGIDDAEIRRITHGMWDNLGRVFAESLLVDQIARDPDRFEIDDPEHVFDLIRAGQPASMATLHMGNWEMAGAISGQQNIPLSGVYKRLSNPVVEDWLLASRQRHYVGGLFCTDEKTRVVRSVLGVLKGGCSIAMVADLYERSAPVIDFAGAPARCINFPVVAARSHGVPLLAIRILRKRGTRFRVEVRRIPLAETENRTADIDAANAALHAQFGRWVLQTPEQWFWIHPKWEATRQELRQM